MIRTPKLLPAVALVALAGTAWTTGPAWALPSLQLESGGDMVTVVDGGPGDSNPVVGVVTYIGPVGVFDINVSTGTTKPANGTPALPDIDLNSINSSNEGGMLTIRFSETDYIGGGDTSFVTNVGGTAQGTAEFWVYADPGNAPFAETTSVAHLGPFSEFGDVTAFSDTDVQAATLNGPYSLTQVAKIIHREDGTTSFNMQTVTVPAPASLLLLGSGLLGLGAFARRRRHQRV